MFRNQKQVIRLSLILSVVLMGIKFLAYALTNSNAILTDALESIVNVVASGFAFYSVSLAAMPRDENHPYGHGKVEFFSALVEGGLILIAGVFIVGKGVYSIFFPQEIEQIAEGMVLLAITGIINYLLGGFLIRKSKEFHSLVLYADGKHLHTDAFSTLGLLFGLGLFYLTNLVIIDSLLSVGIGLYILFHGYMLLRKSVGGLMDESDVEMMEEVVGILQKNRREAWIDIHNLRLQRYGTELHIDCHLTLPNYYNLVQVHEEVSKMDKLVNKSGRFSTEFFIHADPCLPQCCHYCRVENCPIRSEDKKEDIEWTLDMMVRNKKHFERKEK